ncbi:major capsid protein, partial [Pseudomonas aeruginosa]
AKLRKFNKRIVAYILDGATNIQVESYPAQGLRNHRNTIKVNLGSGAGGANIDLTTATQEQLAAFFTTGAFGQAARLVIVGLELGDRPRAADPRRI